MMGRGFIRQCIAAAAVLFGGYYGMIEILMAAHDAGIGK